MNKKVTDLSSYKNDWYKPGKGLLIRSLWFVVNVIFFMNPIIATSALKRVLLRMFGARVGKGVIIKPSVNIKYPWKLVIGDHVWIGEKVWIDNLGNVNLGDNSCLSQGAMLLCGNHDFKKSTFDLKVGDITIENGAWIGAFAVVCPGVTCKSHSVLTVKSVATSDLEAYYIYKGNPAAKHKEGVIS